MKNILLLSLLILSGCQLDAAPGGTLMVNSNGVIVAPPGALTNFAAGNGFLSNNSTGVVLTGTFSGNLGGVTNLMVTNVSGTLTNNLTGNAANATNFSGSLSGNVTGTQGATVVAIAPATAITGTVNITNLTAALQTLSSNNGGSLTNLTHAVQTLNFWAGTTAANQTAASHWMNPGGTGIGISQPLSFFWSATNMQILGLQMFINCSSGAGTNIGAGTNVPCTVQLGGTNTLMTCTLLGISTTTNSILASDFAHPFSIPSQTNLDILIVPTAGTTASTLIGGTLYWYAYP